MVYLGVTWVSFSPQTFQVATLKFLPQSKMVLGGDPKLDFIHLSPVSFSTVSGVQAGSRPCLYISHLADM